MDSGKRYYLIRIDNTDNLYGVIPFKRDKEIIGRSLEATYVIPNNHISRKHAIFSKVLEDKWKVKNLSPNGVYVNEELVPIQSEREIEVGDEIKFGHFTYRFGRKTISAVRKKVASSAKRLKSSDSRSELQANLTLEHESILKKLEKSDALQARLQEEQGNLSVALQNEKEQLEKQYAIEREKLEEKYAAGMVAQQAMLQEKESLAEKLEHKVTDLQERLVQQQEALQLKLKNEEQQRHFICQEKEDVLKRLEEEKKKLEEEMRIERAVLAAEREELRTKLKTTESHWKDLQKEVEVKESMIKEKEEEQMKAKEEKDILKNKLAQEKMELQEELEKVRHALTEKNQQYEKLDSDLKTKDEDLQEKMMSIESGVQERVYAEVEKTTALAKQQLEDLVKEKADLEKKLRQAQEFDKDKLEVLEDALSTVEAQKLSLEQELACRAITTDNARKEVVDSVSNVLENELQCPICNELFITAIMLGCSHTFCKYCIEQWKKNKKECPNCRAVIRSETRSLVVDNFIDKIVPTLSQEHQDRRLEIVNERAREIATMEAAAAAAAAAASTSRGGRRGRGRGRNAYGRRNEYGMQDAGEAHHPTGPRNQLGGYMNMGFTPHQLHSYPDLIRRIGAARSLYNAPLLYDPRSGEWYHESRNGRGNHRQ